MCHHLELKKPFLSTQNMFVHEEVWNCKKTFMIGQIGDILLTSVVNSYSPPIVLVFFHPLSPIFSSLYMYQQSSYEKLCEEYNEKSKQLL